MSSENLTPRGSLNVLRSDTAKRGQQQKNNESNVTHVSRDPLLAVQPLGKRKKGRVKSTLRLPASSYAATLNMATDDTRCADDAVVAALASLANTPTTVPTTAPLQPTNQRAKKGRVRRGVGGRVRRNASKRSRVGSRDESKAVRRRSSVGSKCTTGTETRAQASSSALDDEEDVTETDEDDDTHDLSAKPRPRRTTRPARSASYSAWAPSKAPVPPRGSVRGRYRVSHRTPLKADASLPGIYSKSTLYDVCERSRLIRLRDKLQLKKVAQFVRLDPQVLGRMLRHECVKPPENRVEALAVFCHHHDEEVVSAFKTTLRSKGLTVEDIYEECMRTPTLKYLAISSPYSNVVSKKRGRSTVVGGTVTVPPQTSAGVVAVSSSEVFTVENIKKWMAHTLDLKHRVRIDRPIIHWLLWEGAWNKLYNAGPYRLYPGNPSYARAFHKPRGQALKPSETGKQRPALADEEPALPQTDQLQAPPVITDTSAYSRNHSTLRRVVSDSVASKRILHTPRRSDKKLYFGQRGLHSPFPSPSTIEEHLSVSPSTTRGLSLRHQFSPSYRPVEFSFAGRSEPTVSRSQGSAPLTAASSRQQPAASAELPNAAIVTSSAASRAHERLKQVYIPSIPGSGHEKGTLKVLTLPTMLMGYPTCGMDVSPPVIDQRHLPTWTAGSSTTSAAGVVASSSSATSMSSGARSKASVPLQPQNVSPIKYDAQRHMARRPVSSLILLHNFTESSSTLQSPPPRNAYRNCNITLPNTMGSFPSPALGQRTGQPSSAAQTMPRSAARARALVRLLSDTDDKPPQRSQSYVGPRLHIRTTA